MNKQGDLLCSLTGFISFVVLQHTPDRSWCVARVCLPVLFTHTHLPGEIPACHGNRLHPGGKAEELCFVKAPFLVKAQAINRKITANKACFV